MIRTRPAPRLQRRQLFRSAFAALGGLALLELAGAVAPFFRVNKIVGLGEQVPVGTRAEILARFAATRDAPILFARYRFFLLHAPGGIVAAYRKCTHLGCAVPFAPAADRFQCPCHGSEYDKRTAVVLKSPAPKPLQLFHIREENGTLIVDTNPLNVIDRHDNRWDPAVVEIPDQARSARTTPS